MLLSEPFVPRESQRLIIGPDSHPVLHRHVRLRRDEIRGKWVILAPEKVLWPDEISVEILSRCTGKISVATLSQDLAKAYDAPADQVEADVIEFLQEWADRLLIRTEETPS
ncbi:pyrroloquinoline quinone biosynthesis peptide chaperone PqqD [Roseibium suaedae]|uniref:Pyrroloquinoline quinone biosynthesis protein D n=1 Tax=Roseibium suaedae TaxID=735517 RepID=A0A1M7N686_9HYPH|nr:pyrroloquinoline quinone biosynthesis peptide chaperone PqqD [Roseibium suaedae]SHM98962.1 pyrroloquinoline quinone biosynthesis protein D [Roseibium suaedae]